jgi:adenine-specific DNA-methyltransferase
MNYIGSKFTLSSWIEKLIKQVSGKNLHEKVFCDIFAGTGIIARVFKSQVKKIISNDLEYYSYILNQNYIGNSYALKNAKEYLHKLNALTPQIGFISKYYSTKGERNRAYFSLENAAKIDAMRIQIQEWFDAKVIDKPMYYFLLSSLIESADRVANTASVYGAFLKKMKKSALEEIVLEPAYFEETASGHEVYNEDANELIKKIYGDILYLDPPYNRRQYGANYHLLNTICLYDDFIPYGKTGIREYNHSNYCKSTQVLSCFEELIKDANFQYIFLSYNHEGLMNQEQIAKIMQKYGHYFVEKKEYPRFIADKLEKRANKMNATFEYLHVLEKR